MAQYSQTFAHIGRQKRAATVARRRQERMTMEHDPQEERFRQHEALIQGLARIWQEQQEFNRQQVAINAQLTAAIERLDITQARIEALLARMIAQGDNGREA